MPADRLHVLLVEDNDDHADLVAAFLEDAVDPVVDLVRVASLAEAVRALRDSRTEGPRFGAILTDQQLPDSEFWETVPHLVEAAGEEAGGPPVIALTTIGDLDVALDALGQGAQDYVVKADMSTEVLQRALRYAVERARHAAELRTTNEALRQTLDHVRQMQAQIVEQEKLAGLGRLLGGVAHELMNPLYLMMNYAAEAEQRAEEIAALDPARPENRDEIRDLVADLQTNTQKIVEHARRSDGVIRSMFEHARGVAGNLQEVVLTDVVDTALQRLATLEPELSVQRQYEAGGGPLVYGVVAALTRMVYNVLENAVLAVRQSGGEASGGEAPARIRVAVRAEAGPDGLPNAVVEVADSGTGIAPDVLPHVFEPFFTAWEQGSRRIGLGLSLGHNIASSHGGRIEICPSDLGGACVRITLPVGVRERDGIPEPFVEADRTGL